eukprot:TRINITY_DN7210_c0_g1_i1.p1 TRINITY_DN7210_c0_g1~~TRINITY_DN7210_c0_g1_i1.p1  ORF type:complete len:107 (-),score=23.42 TRINITY_DN7210_c0_g1_i1:23-343(-)
MFALWAFLLITLTLEAEAPTKPPLYHIGTPGDHLTRASSEGMRTAGAVPQVSTGRSTRDKDRKANEKDRKDKQEAKGEKEEKEKKEKEEMEKKEQEEKGEGERRRR